MKKRLVSSILVLVLLLSCLVLPTGALDVSVFTDVPAEEWFYEPVKFVTAKEYFIGTDDTLFSPNDEMSRAMFVTVLSRLENVKADDSVSSFEDVPANAYFTGAVKWAFDNKIVDGTTATTFEPYRGVTREEMAAIMIRYIDYHQKKNNVTHKTTSSPVVFTDEDAVSAWAKAGNYVDRCSRFGLIIGYNDGSFRPLNTSTRAEVATVISRLAWLINPTGTTIPTTYTYNVTFNANGGTGTMAAQSFSFTEPATSANVTLNANTFTRAGYTFAGWGTAAGGPAVYADGATVTGLSGNLTLFAQWTAITTTKNVTYKANGGTGADVTVPFSFTTPATSASVTIAANTFTAPAAGYTFAGWNTAADGTGTAYTAGTAYDLSDDLTLFAQWNPPGVHTYNVTFNANGGTGTMAAQSFSFTDPATSADVTLNANTFTRAGYDFAGWNTASDGTGTAYIDGATVTGLSGNLTLFAQWTAITTTKNVTYKANGGTGADVTVPFSFTTPATSASVTIAANTFTYTGYTFTGWNTAADGTGTAYTAGTAYDLSDDLTLFAQWQINDYVITYHSNPTDSTVTETTQEDPITPAAPGSSETFTTQAVAQLKFTSVNAATGKNDLFVKWNTKADGTGDDYLEGATVTTTGDMDLYAIWLPDNDYIGKAFKAAADVYGPKVEAKVKEANEESVALQLLGADKKLATADYGQGSFSYNIDVLSNTPDAPASHARHQAVNVSAALNASAEENIINTAATAALTALNIGKSATKAALKADADAVIAELESFFGIKLKPVDRTRIQDDVVDKVYDNGKNIWSYFRDEDGEYYTGTFTIAAGASKEAVATVNVDQATKTTTLSGSKKQLVKDFAIAIAKDLYAELKAETSWTDQVQMKATVEITFSGNAASSKGYKTATDNYPYVYDIDVTVDLDGAGLVEYMFDTTTNLSNLKLHVTTAAQAAYTRQVMAVVDASMQADTVKTELKSKATDLLNNVSSRVKAVLPTGVVTDKQIADAMSQWQKDNLNLDDLTNSVIYKRYWLGDQSAAYNHAALDALKADILADPGLSWINSIIVTNLDLHAVAEQVVEGYPDGKAWATKLDKVQSLDKLDDIALSKLSSVLKNATAQKIVGNRGNRYVQKAIDYIDKLPAGASVTLKGVTLNETLLKSYFSGKMTNKQVMDQAAALIDAYPALGALTLADFADGEPITVSYNGRSFTFVLWIVLD